MAGRWRWPILVGVLGLYLIGLGFLTGIMVERLQFDGRRTAILRQYVR